FTPDKAVFDRLFREHLQAVYEGAGLKIPAWLKVPVVRLGRRDEGFLAPLGFVRPTLDGRPTQFYEWYQAGRFRLDQGGGAMHRQQRLARDLYYGYDEQRFYLRLDCTDRTLPGEDLDLVVEFLAPRSVQVRVRGLAPGRREVTVSAGVGLPGRSVAGAPDASLQVDGAGESAAAAAPPPEAVCEIGSILELAVSFASLGLVPGDGVELVAHLGRPGEPGETLPFDDLVRFTVPESADEAKMWSA